MRDISAIFKNNTQSKQSPIRRKFPQSGHPGLRRRFSAIVDFHMADRQNVEKMRKMSNPYGTHPASPLAP
jgi:hypothetical protein